MSEQPKTEAKHTPEPWKYESTESYDDYDEYERAEVLITGSDKEQDPVFASCGCCQGISCNKADIERIIACVNAFAGIENPASAIITERRNGDV